MTFNEQFFASYATWSKYCLYESIQTKQQSSKTDDKGNVHFQYNIEINGVEFVYYIDAIKCKYEIDPMKQDIASLEFKKVNAQPMKQLASDLNNNADKFLLKVQFRDSSNRVELTGDVKTKAFAALKSMQQCVTDAAHKIGLENVFGLEFHIKKTEIKRLELYKALLKYDAALKNYLKNSVDDHATDVNFVTSYFWI